MTDWKMEVRRQRFTSLIAANIFIAHKKEELRWVGDDLGYNGPLIQLEERESGECIVTWREPVKIPFSQSIGRQVDLQAVREMSKPQREKVWDSYASEEWEALRKSPVKLPKYMRKRSVYNDD